MRSPAQSEAGQQLRPLRRTLLRCFTGILRKIIIPYRESAMEAHGLYGAVCHVLLVKTNFGGPP